MKWKITKGKEVYMSHKKAINIEIKAELKMRGAVLLVAISLSIPN